MKKLFSIFLLGTVVMLSSCGGEEGSGDGGDGGESVDLSKPVTVEELSKMDQADVVGEVVTIKQTCDAPMAGNVIRFPKPGEEEKSMFDQKCYAKCVFKEMWSGKSGEEEECTIKGKVSAFDEKDGLVIRECEWVE